MFTLVALSYIAATQECALALIGPEKITTCEDFEIDAYFNPYEIITSTWKIFYFWGNTTELYPIVFSLPAKQRIDKIKAVVEAVDPYMGIEWHRAVLVMEPRPGLTVLFLSSVTPGAFRALVKLDQRSKVQPHPLPLIKFADVRLKIIGMYLVMMCCEDLTAYALARVDQMPTTEADCVKAALTLGVSLPNGRSYVDVKRFGDEL